MPDIYRYEKSIDKKIITAVEQVLHTTVVSASKIKLGEINHVYKVVTPDTSYVARVFRYRDFPQNGKLEWVEKQLTTLKAPHAKMVYYSRSGRFFPNGFMISEYIEGLNGTEAVKKNRITESRLYTELGKTARSTHRVSLPKYGPINNGKGKFSGYTKMQLTEVKQKLKELTRKDLLENNPYAQVKDIIQKELGAFEKKFHPVLLHGDMSETNTIVTANKKVILVDWDNARSGLWLADFIELSRRHMLMKEWRDNPMRQLRARKAFFKGYGSIPFSPAEIAKMEHALQLIRQIWQMHYYAFDRKDMKNFNLVKKIFYSLLNS